MNHHKLISLVLVFGLGISLHFAFCGLKKQLPQLFSQIEKEEHQTQEILAPLPVIEEKMEEAPLPKISELALLDSQESAKENLKKITARKLITALPVPRLNTSHSVTPVSVAFEITPELEPIVSFWRDIYAVYTTHQVVLHDTEDLSIRYSVLDFTELDNRPISDAEKKSIRETEINQEMEKVRAHLSPEAAERLRSQTGLKDRFQEGLTRSARYMPHFEQIFQSYGIPKEIARLPFVESLFLQQAYSKVGAAGLWQFMASSARRYMTVNDLVDERYDPIMATHAAARLLLHNFELLGNWPLAINAYNSGPGNLLKAISKLGTHDITRIITEFKAGSYAFASRNFYPSFLAALHVYENQEKYFGKIKKDPLLEFDLIQIPITMSFEEIAQLADTSLNNLKDLNPAFDNRVIHGNYSLPAGSQVRIPKESQTTFAARFVSFQTNVSSTQLANSKYSPEQ